MQAPVDYPIVDSVRDTQCAEDQLTYAVLLDRMKAAKPVTQEMMLQARLGIETAQGIPDAPKPTPVSAPKPFSVIAQSLLASEALSRRDDVSTVLSRWTRAIR